LFRSLQSSRRSASDSATGWCRGRSSRPRRARGASGSPAARRSRSACRSASSSAPTRAGSRPASRRRRSRRRWSPRARTCGRVCGPSRRSGSRSSGDARPLAYTLLGGVRVLEVALLAPDLLGMHLADLGAEVVKIEQPPGGDYLREIGGRKRAGLNLMHLRWNRGKKSVTLDLRRREGQRLLHRLAARADVFVDGLRPGAAARCAADYATLAAVNPRLVYCTLSGAGTWGPYAGPPTHGVAYDAFAGLAPPATHPDGSLRIPAYTAVGMFAAPLYAALAVCAALLQARTTGTGRLLEVAELDAAASWQAEHLDAAP